MENFINGLYQLILILCLVFSIVSSIYFYLKNKYKLKDLIESKSLKDGNNLYSIIFKKNKDNFILSPNKEEYLYYQANLHYEERVDSFVGKKKNLDTKFYPKNKEKIYDNDVIIQIFPNKEFEINTKNIEFSLNTTINDNPNITMKENEKILFLEERFIKENTKYYAMIEINNGEINLNNIKVSDVISNFKNDFFFHLLLLWIPTITFALTYFFII